MGQLGYPDVTRDMVNTGVDALVSLAISVEREIGVIHSQRNKLALEFSELKRDHLELVERHFMIGRVNILINTCRANYHQLENAHEIMNRFWYKLAHRLEHGTGDILHLILLREKQLLVVDDLLQTKSADARVA